MARDKSQIIIQRNNLSGYYIAENQDDKVFFLFFTFILYSKKFVKREKALLPDFIL